MDRVTEMAHDNHPEAKIRSAVRRVMDLLARREYESLAALTAPPSRLQGSEIKQTVEAYPGSVRMPNDSELQFDVVAIHGQTPNQYSVDAPVFTAEMSVRPHSQNDRDRWSRGAV